MFAAGPPLVRLRAPLSPAGRRDWGSGGVSLPFRGAVAPLTSDQSAGVDLRDTFNTATLMVDDADIDIQVGDRIEAGRVTWTVTGGPLDYSSPLTGWRPGLVFSLVRVGV